MMKTLKTVSVLLLALTLAPGMRAQQTLTLEECREMAIQNSKELDQARTKVRMAGYDRKIARANYLPNISATGSYLYNNRELSLVSDAQSAMLTNMGTTAQVALDGAVAGIGQKIAGGMTDAMTQLQTAIMSNPQMAAEYMGSPMWQTVLKMFQQMDLSGMSAPDIQNTFNAVGKEIDDALHLDIHNIYVGAVSLQQPVFMGGKILFSNQAARLAEELARSRYDMEYADIVVGIDQAYWQIVSIAAKKRLAESYADLLHKLEKDVNLSVQEGVATQSDALQIKVKANEADMLLTKATNGLTLAKMLLCKEIGLPLDSRITLADETLEVVPLPQRAEDKDMEAIWRDRPETHSLELASQIYEKKALIARADMMPKVALTANYLVSNPNAFHGFSNSWNGGMFTAGVAVNIPLFHGTEALQKTKKARLEATLYRDQLDEAKNLISMQVAQSRQQYGEAGEKLAMATSNLDSAEENLRTATVGFEAGVIDANTVLAAQTAWLQAHSELIDAGIDLQMAASNLLKAQGYYQSEK